MNGRKWNGLGKDQIAVLQWTSDRGRDLEYIVRRIRLAKRTSTILQSLLRRGLLQEVDGVFHATDQGKAVLKPEYVYKKWLLDWGKA